MKPSSGESPPGPLAGGRAGARDREDTGAERILVVDDEDAVRDLMCRVLELHGFQVLSAPDGDSALELVRGLEARLDLAVCDVSLPGISGGQLVAGLVALRPDLAFLYVSGYRVESPKALTLADGAGRPIPFLPKPFTPTDLILAVRGALDRRRILRG